MNDAIIEPNNTQESISIATLASYTSSINANYTIYMPSLRIAHMTREWHPRIEIIPFVSKYVTGSTYTFFNDSDNMCNICFNNICKNDTIVMYECYHYVCKTCADQTTHYMRCSTCNAIKRKNKILKNIQNEHYAADEKIYVSTFGLQMLNMIKNDVLMNELMDVSVDDILVDDMLVDDVSVDDNNYINDID
jgi:hypothetical protein